jgi:aminoglycoside phosphotransferase
VPKENDVRSADGPTGDGDPRDGLLPAGLGRELESTTLASRSVGRLGTYIYRYAPADGGPGLYLKLARLDSEDNLGDELLRLEWLQFRLRVPEVVSYEEWDGWRGLLIRELSGRPASDPVFASDARVIGAIAETLRQIHALDVTDCPFRGMLDWELDQAERRMCAGAFNRTAFLRHTTGRTPEEVLDELRANRHLARETVFTHGDFCMPNVMMDGWTPSGVLDWAQASVGDRSRDLMAMLGSIEMNCDAQWQDVFLEAYGEDVDPERIRYFTLLDQFFASDDE